MNYPLYRVRASLATACVQILSADKVRLALLHERPTALDVVLAGETFGNEAIAESKVAVGRILEQLADDAFDRVNRQRRVPCDRLGILLDEGLQLARRHHLIDEAHAQRLLGAVVARREENLLGGRRADEIGEAANALDAVAEAELGGRHAEFRILRADAQIAGRRHRDAAADAPALDHRD